MNSSIRKKEKTEGYFDYTLLIVVAFLLVLGLVMIYSTSSFMYGWSYFTKQCVATLLGVAVMLMVTFFRTYHFWGYWSFAFAGVAVFALLLLKTPIGITRNGATRWLNVFGLSVQPAEIAKLAVIILTAYLIDKFGKAIHTIKGFSFAFAPSVVLAAMVYFISDNLSSAIIVVGISFVMLFISTRNYKWYIVGAVVIAIAAGLYIFYIDRQGSAGGFRGMRILAWLHPEDYSSGTAYQTLQAIYAIGSGGIFGKGLGEGMQKLGYIPEAQNDMIFSIICEELGLVGAGAIIILFIILVWRCMIVASNARDKFGALIVVGVMAHIAIQVIMNIAVVTNIIPNTGVSLPFISYGGSSVVMLLFEIGLVLNVARNIELKELVH